MNKIGIIISVLLLAVGVAIDMTYTNIYYSFTFVALVISYKLEKEGRYLKFSVKEIFLCFIFVPIILSMIIKYVSTIIG